MNSTVRLLGVLVSIPFLASHWGCTPAAGTNWGAGAGSITVTEDGTKISYTLERLTRNDQVYLVVVANGSAAGSHSGGEGDFRGYLLTRDGAHIDWACSTPDGKSGKVKVNGQEFNLAGGALFLVSTTEKPLRVEQLAVAAGELQACADGKKFPGLAKAEPRIASFVESCRVDQ